jgi:hypothetical protein
MANGAVYGLAKAVIKEIDEKIWIEKIPDTLLLMLLP